jgi:hypothetical protein
MDQHTYARRAAQVESVLDAIAAVPDEVAR